MKKIEIVFEYLDETKNNYIFKQENSDKKPIMFPGKIYLNKSLFAKKPKVVTLNIT